MLKKTIKYTDWNGNEREEDFLFNITEAELREMEYSVVGGYTGIIQKIMQSQDVPSIMKIFKDFIFKTYGEKTPDGRRFIKSEELSIEFSQTQAYSNLYVELSTDPVAAAEFIKGVLPENIRAQIEENEKKEEARDKLPASGTTK